MSRSPEAQPSTSDAQETLFDLDEEGRPINPPESPEELTLFDLDEEGQPIDPVDVEPIDTTTEGEPAPVDPSAAETERMPPVEETREMDPALDEHRLAERLIDPELTGVRALNDSVNRATLKTINVIEGVVNKGKDVRAYVKGRRLTAKKNRAARKLERLEKKARKSWFRSRRKKFAEKAAIQRKELTQRTAAQTKHRERVETRHGRVQEARGGRLDAYTERRNNLLLRAQDATANKAERRDRRLARAEKKSTDPETRKRLADRRHVIFDAFAKWEAQLADKELSLV